MGKELITSDTHFDHGNICIYCNRPFIKPGDLDNTGRFVSRDISSKRAAAMTEVLINDWNSAVDEDDIVYHAGDFSFGDPLPILKRLNGRIILIPGNHDKPILDLLYRMPSLSDKIRVYGGLPIRNEKVYSIAEVEMWGRTISISHFALEVWNKSHRGAWNLFGHSHNTLPEATDKMRTDVGIDSHYIRCGNYAPYTQEEVEQIMKNKVFKPVDHHGNV
jgi:calcineurin-like phosphoesterase family protein